MDKNSDVKAILKQTEHEFLMLDQSVAALKSYTKNVFSTSSVIIPLFGALQVFSSIPDNIKWIYIGIIALMLVLYVVLVVYCVRILRASLSYGSIKMEWPILKEAFMGKNEREIILMEISANLNAIKLNYPLINKKKRWSNVISWLFPAIIILALVATTLLKFI